MGWNHRNGVFPQIGQNKRWKSLPESMKQIHLELGSQKLNLLASLIFLISLDSIEAFKDIGLFTCPPFVGILNNCSPSFPAAGCHTCLCAVRPVPHHAHTLMSLLFSVQGELWPHHLPHATHGPRSSLLLTSCLVFLKEENKSHA